MGNSSLWVEHQIKKLTIRNDYLEFVYALILNSDFDTSEKLLKFLYNNSLNFIKNKELYPYLLYLILIKYFYSKNNESIPEECKLLMEILHGAAYISRHLGFYDENNPIVNFDYKLQLLKSLLMTKKILYWEKDAKQDFIKVFCLSGNNKFGEYKIHSDSCSVYKIKKEGRFLKLYAKDTEFIISGIREIEDSPSINRIASIYEDISTSIDLASKKYCPFCNPKRPLEKKGVKISNACDSCTMIRNFISINENLDIKSLNNDLYKISKDSLLKTIQSRGDLLSKHIDKIEKELNKNNFSDVKINELKKIRELIKNIYRLQENVK